MSCVALNTYFLENHGYDKQEKDQNGKMRFQVIIRLKGTPSQIATFTRLTDAKKWAQHTEAAIREGRHFKTSEAKKHTLENMVDRYIELFNPPDYKKAQLIWWKKRLGSHILCDITPAMIANGRDELLKGISKRGVQRSPSTAVRYIAALSHLGNLIEVPLPNLQQRAQIFQLHLSFIAQSRLDTIYDCLAQELSQLTEGFSGADIRATIQRTANLVFMETIRAGHFTQDVIATGCGRAVTSKDFIPVIELIFKQKKELHCL